MNKNAFQEEAMTPKHPNYQNCISRESSIYQRKNDLRTPFSRDYNRIIFSLAYRRLKHKTQVFFATNDDHVCTRSEHVNLVDSVSYTISSYLGLNTELTRAIAVGHDLGHAPFGHGGEKIISKLCNEYALPTFFHERNSLYFVDCIETLEDNEHNRHNLNLTYAIRDGIISHCGEMNQKSIKRRNDFIDLKTYTHPGMYNPYTWEGCVVKMSDKIAYLARDIEDALRLNILTHQQVNELKETLNEIVREPFEAINNGSIVNYFIQDVCQNSSLQEGISLSKEAFEVMKVIMKFNYQNIYLIDRLNIHHNYVSLILRSIFDALYKYKDNDACQMIEHLKNDEKIYPHLISGYLHWLEKYGLIQNYPRNKYYQNRILYDFTQDKQAMEKSIIDYLSGMSDAYILKIFNELITFSSFAVQKTYLSQ